MDEIEKMRARQQELVEENEQIVALADDESRELSDEESEQIDANSAEFKNLGRQIERRETIRNQAETIRASGGRQTDADDAAGGDDEGEEEEREPADRRTRQISNAATGRATRRVPAEPRARDHGQWGFRSLGEFAVSVRKSGFGSMDERLALSVRNSTSYGREAVGEDGGYLVPPDYSAAIMKKVFAEDNLISRTNQLKSGSNKFVVPRDDTAPWAPAGGIEAFWEGEGDQLAGRKPKFKPMETRLNKLTALVEVTEELLEDAPGLDAYIREKAPEAMNWKVDEAIIRGTGAGMPAGILDAPATITVDKDPGQAADTITFGNIQGMYGRLYAPCRKNAVWLMNQDVETQLETLKFTVGVGEAAIPLYIPAGGLSDTPYARLKGRPVVPHEVCSQLGDIGDINLLDLSRYLTVRKLAGKGMRVDTSIHLRFDQDLMTYRFIFRLGGQPWWGGPVPRRAGDNTLSCFVTLAERA